MEFSLEKIGPFINKGLIVTGTAGTILAGPVQAQEGSTDYYQGELCPDPIIEPSVLDSNNRIRCNEQFHIIPSQNGEIDWSQIVTAEGHRKFFVRTLQEVGIFNEADIADARIIIGLDENTRNTVGFNETDNRYEIQFNINALNDLSQIDDLRRVAAVDSVIEEYFHYVQRKRYPELWTELSTAGPRVDNYVTEFVAQSFVMAAKSVLYQTEEGQFYIDREDLITIPTSYNRRALIERSNVVREWQVESDGRLGYSYASAIDPYAAGHLYGVNLYRNSRLTLQNVWSLHDNVIDSLTYLQPHQVRFSDIMASDSYEYTSIMASSYNFLFDRGFISPIAVDPTNEVIRINNGNLSEAFPAYEQDRLSLPYSFSENYYNSGDNNATLLIIQDTYNEYRVLEPGDAIPTDIPVIFLTDVELAKENVDVSERNVINDTPTDLFARYPGLENIVNTASTQGYNLLASGMILTTNSEWQGATTTYPSNGVINISGTNYYVYSAHALTFLESNPNAEIIYIAAQPDNKLEFSPFELDFENFTEGNVALIRQEASEQGFSSVTITFISSDGSMQNLNVYPEVLSNLDSFESFDDLSIFSINTTSLLNVEQIVNYDQLNIQGDINLTTQHTGYFRDKYPLTYFVITTSEGTYLWDPVSSVLGYYNYETGETSETVIELEEE